MFHGIAKFSASRFWIPFCGHPLKHSLLPKVMNERHFVQGQMTAHRCEILPHRGVSYKRLTKCLSIWPDFCKEQNSRRETIDAMHDKGPLLLRFQFCRKKREDRWKIGVIRRHRQHFGRLIEDYNGIVLVKD